MAVITVRTPYYPDIGSFIDYVSDYNTSVGASSTSYEFEADPVSGPEEGAVVELGGFGFAYSGTVTPTGGTVTSIELSINGTLIADIVGLFFPLTTVYAAFNNGTAAVFALFGDTTFVGGRGIDRIALGGGDDDIQLFAGNDYASGGTGNDVINGGGGADTLIGGTGNDLLYGGDGKDALTGGGGADSFVFDTAPSNATNRDAILDFDAPLDTVRLENAVFTKLKTGFLAANYLAANAAGTASDPNDYVVYETDTGNLFYDADGNGAGASVRFATLVNKPAITAADFFVV